MPSTNLTGSDREFLADLQTLLADPAQQDNPMREPLVRLLEQFLGQRERLERLVRISDGYHHLARDQRLSLVEQYDKQVRRLEKLARISDRYQNSLRELSLALRDAALHDPLTGLANRRFLMERLREEADRSKRLKRGFSLAIMNVDHFKHINDEYGHEAGDLVLQAIARAIESQLREYDQCGRWGGEEFLILLPETPLDQAQAVLERIRVAVAEINRVGGEISTRLSASFGLAEHLHEENFSATISRAYQALYAAKAAGRNRVEQA
ncbi:MAG: GGDEF domain-containing protein [Candidatus Dactylopiibacterium carminicum]|uniref:diguanylate cyclase n=1 Tax=Candidatus Dactylopiibacterium carminicum TaxID=857335 RepID=A0A272EVB3_9RHOO|nr:biofilm regulation diguanylate cyclase SiaD [Candidatus Dactylopiibacterium carminicum]KAF7600126.1 GGDEF domain-containing protein [Candidatus Dactylopiibacterium carminicum]PAS94044.1 MAG: GGDEF domain-containing protein [Candidatus Dactylopiibacterium carminicum]PAT00124.1 MAG: GGDEF domain-containing protein [Candidatus Dactylopiibacterium carminicum]